MTIYDVAPKGVVFPSDKGDTGDTGAKGATGDTGPPAQTSYGTIEFQGNGGFSWTNLNGSNDKNYHITGSWYANTSGANPYMCLNFNGDWAANYHYVRSADNGTAHSTVNSNTDGAIVFASMPSGHTGHIMFDIDIIPNVYGVTQANVLYRYMDDSQAGTRLTVGQCAGNWQSAANVTAISLYCANTTATSWQMGVLTVNPNKSWW